MKQLFLMMLLLTMISQTNASESASQTVSDMAVPWQRPAGAPRHSDVCFSIRWMRKDMDPFEKIRLFHGTRFDWVYVRGQGASRPTFIQECRDQGYPVCNTTSVCRQDLGKPEGKPESYKVGRARDINGNPMTASHQPWSPHWGCISNPDLADMMFQEIRFSIDSGVNYMFFDDPSVVEMLKRGGEPKDRETRGCFCEHCQTRFRNYLGAKLGAQELKVLGIANAATFDYRQYILEGHRNADLRRHYEASFKEAISEFWKAMRKRADQHAGRTYPFGCNNGSFTEWQHPVDLFDFAVGELSSYDPPTPPSLWKKALRIARMNKAQAFTLRSMDPIENRKTLCLAYALGCNFVCPWDVWVKGYDRYFAESQDFNYLYAFVRDNAHWLDGYEYAAAVGKGVRDDWYGDQPPATALGNEDVYVFVRAVPGAVDKPVVVHLYDWGKTAKPIRVVLNNHRFFPGKQLSCRLLTPVKQSLEENARAEKTKDFSKFTHSAELSCSGDGRQTTVEIPVLDTWAMVIVSPAKQESQ